jgi:hypothetical protein
VTAAILKLEMAGGAVDRRDAGAEMQFDPVLAVEFRWAQRNPLLGSIAG